MVHGYALNTVYGWSIYLLGAIWDSLTQLLLHLGKESRKSKKMTPSAPVEPEPQGIKLPKPKDDKTEEQTYPLLPREENSAYTLELKG